MYGALGGLPVNTSGWMVDAGERPAVNAATTLISTLAIASGRGGTSQEASGTTIVDGGRLRVSPGHDLIDARGEGGKRISAPRTATEMRV